MKINHLNHYQIDALIYCERHYTCVSATQGFVDENCAICEMFNGHLQGNGIECLYEDSLIKDKDVSAVRIDDPVEWEKKRNKSLLREKSARNIIRVKGDKK